MVLLQVFTKNVKVIYKSTLLSKAIFLVFIFGVISVVLPFIIAYKSKGFWMKRDVFHEQPEIKFKGEYVFTATTNDYNKPIFCSSLPYYEQALKELDKCSSIKVHEVDYNFDGKPDEFTFSLRVDLPEGTHLTSLHIIILLDFKLNNVCPLQMQTAAIYHTFLPITVASYTITGDLGITQSSPVLCHKQQINNFYNYSVVGNVSNVDEYAIPNIVAEYSKRNVSTILTNTYTTFSLAQSPYFSLNCNLRYPEQRIYYKPGFWQILKWAWIQYLSIYIIVSWLVTKIKAYIFNRRLVLFYEDNPVKKKQ